MRGLHEKYPEDTDAATLYAAATMELSPWNYWTPDGRPRERTPDLLAVLEAVLERDPRHEGALHYYIHAVESVDPRRGERAADALRDLAPGAGHLLHMPSHIYMQLGRYAESYDSNVEATEADEGYLAQCRAQGIYPLNYYPHNVHFLAWAAFMQGRSAEALAAARKVAAGVPTDLEGDDWALFETFLAMPLFTMVRFGMWDEVAAEPEPADHTLFTKGVWRYARGMAAVHGGERKRAARELAELRRVGANPRAASIPVGFSTVERLLDIAASVLAGEIDAARGRHDAAVAHLDRALRLESGLQYNEPPAWYYPVRHTLGAVLLEAGRPVEAEIVYWDDLVENPENGWALYGLWRALEAQGRDAEAAGIKERFDAAWAAADDELDSSRF
jgi:tetratricopeptide (TPR) repeat protein